ncbi:ABC transporter ATP-binding protein [Pseudonocardia sp. NPDC049635]|uniref:ABC transporter ATP-binding protein n=1 Tax=Pseudonocardia sp. NPDC049635 TaxID=3155506 RepID=UPI0033E52C81
MSGEPVQLRGLGRSYPGGGGVGEVDVAVPAGSTLAVLGPSGCGKSTLLRLVAGLEAPDRGEVVVGDEVLSSPGRVVPPERRGMNMVFQDYALWPHLSVRDNIGYGLRHGRHRTTAAARRARVDELIDFLGLEGLGGRRPAEISGGQRQRVAIARALATRPRLLLFDEPLSNLDVQLRAHTRDELAGLLTQLGTTALYVTHDIVEALAVADRILVLHRGRPVQSGTPQQVFERPRTPWVASLTGHTARLVVDGVAPAGRGVVDGTLPGTGGARITGRDGGPGDGAGESVALVHPAAVRIDPAGHLPGRVLSSVFTGRGHSTRVGIGAAGTVTVEHPVRLAVGDTVHLDVDRDGVVVFGAHPSAPDTEGVADGAGPGARTSAPR